jgi:hypothetical protein
MTLEGNVLIRAILMRLKGQCEFKVGYKHSVIFIPYFTSSIHELANDIHVTVHRDGFLKIKPTICTNFSNLFWNEILHVSDSSSVHHQEFFTVHTAMVYVSKPVWHIPLLCVQWKTLDDGQRNCLKHVEIHSKNTFEKLVHLIGFIYIYIYIYIYYIYWYYKI